MARMAAVSPYVLIAMTTDERGQGMRAVIDELGLRSEVFSDAEQLLYHTRGSVPDALVLEHGLAQRVAQLDLVALLRRRKGLEDVPFVYLGPDIAGLQAQLVASGADVFLTLPTLPAVLKAYLERLLSRRRAEGAMRRALEEARNFEQAFRESERMKDDLIHMLVHDLKSPISSVMGLLDHSLEMLASQGDSNVGELLSLARTESQHLLNLAAN